MTKCHTLDIEIPNVRAFNYETGEDLPQSHQQILCCGARLMLSKPKCSQSQTSLVRM